MNTDDLSAEGRVPRGAPTLEQVSDELRRLSSKVDRLLRAVTKDPLDPAAADGIVQRLESQGEEITALARRVTALEVAGAAGREKWGARAWAAFYDALKLAGAAGLGAWIGKGGHP